MRDDFCVRYARPTSGRQLPVEPVLASWDKAGTSSQARSAEFLAAMTGWIGPLPPIPLVLDLSVGLPAKTQLDGGGHDLDNYLYPIAYHLGGQRFVGAFARKTHSPSSTMAVEQARPLPDQGWRPKLVVHTSTSTEKLAWKQEIGRACAEQVKGRLVGGPVSLEVQYRLNSQRNWVNLWKPTIDALGLVLGVPDARRPYNVEDDRITDICFTRCIDDSLGWDVLIEADWAALNSE